MTRGFATRQARMTAILALSLIGVFALPRPAGDAVGDRTVPVATPQSTIIARAPEPTPVVFAQPPLVGAFAARSVGLRASEPTPTPIPATPTPVPPTATPTPVVPNGPLVKNRLVTWYGHPDSNLLGILGEFSDPKVMITKLKAQAAAYQAADPSRPAIPTIELIASVASDTPGEDGLYLNPTRLSLIEQYADLAGQNGCLLLLDIQLGYDSVENEVRRLEPFLKRPYVHLAIDPEFHVKKGEVPGQEFGSLTAAEVTGAAKMLADLVTKNGITDKVLVIHQFRYDMLPDKAKIKPTPHVETVIVMDGFGGPEAKIGNYGAFVRDEPLEFGGIKLFYKQDKPLMTPADVVKLDPSPLVVIYQ